MVKKDKSPLAYRAVVIGLGRIGWTMEGEKYRSVPCTHAGMYHYASETLLVGGFDVNQERCIKFQATYPDCLVSHDNLTDFLADTRAQIISICTNSEEHLAVFRLIWHYALSHPQQILGIFLEKPVGMSEEEGVEIRSMAREISVPTVVCHDRRFYPWFQTLKKNFAPTLTGELRHIRAAVYTSSCSPLLHDGTHLFDLMAYFAGEPKCVTASCMLHNTTFDNTECGGDECGSDELNSAMADNVELGSAMTDNAGMITEINGFIADSYFGHVFFANGTSGSFYIGGRRPYFHFEFALEWEKALLIDANGHCSFYAYQEDGFLLQPQTMPTFENRNPYLVRLTHLLDLIAGRADNYSSVDDGLIVLKIIDAVLYSIQHGSVITAIE